MMNDLPDTARELVAHGKGILAADESIKSADKRLISYGIETSVEMRRQYRDLFLSAPDIEEYLTGVILYSETLDEKASDGTLFTKLLAKRGIMPGIKVDQGIEPMPESPDETITNGILGLPDVLHTYAAQGLKFTKWRAVIRIDGDRLPTRQALVENAKRLAIYALDVQKAGMVPILEPEVLLEGTHSRLRAKEVLIETLNTVIAACQDQAVDLSAVIIKTAMALSGDKSGKKDTPEEVAHDTVEALMSTIPAIVPGIVFLSGGQSSEQATLNLQAIAKRSQELNAPWPLTFSYARALQDEALTAWKGEAENVPAAREAFLKHLKAVSSASKGEYAI
jgi:fructose-bisphosphate aldolase class I